MFGLKFDNVLCVYVAAEADEASAALRDRGRLSSPEAWRLRAYTSESFQGEVGRRQPGSYVNHPTHHPTTTDHLTNTTKLNATKFISNILHTFCN